MTEVNAHEEHHEQDAVPVGPSIPVLLVCAADVIMRVGLPVPEQVEASARIGLWVTLASHTQLRAWARVLGLAVGPSHSQPYVNSDGVLCQLTNVHGQWRDATVTLHCIEPVDALAALRDDGQVHR